MRHLIRATTVVLLIGTLLLYPLLAPPPHRIDEADFQLITEGMTEAGQFAHRRAYEIARTVAV